MTGPQKLSLAAGLLLALVLSCGDEEEGAEPVAPPGPAGLSINAFIGKSGERFSRARADEIELDCSGLLAVELELTNWLLRPPANCGATPQCGHVAVIVDGVVVEASTSTVVVPPLGDAAPGSHHVRAELRLSDRSAFIGDAGTPVADELDITVSVLPCPAAAGGAGGAGGSSGSGGGGGDGGSSGSGAAAGGQGGDDGEGGQGGSSSPGGAGGTGGASPAGGTGGA